MDRRVREAIARIDVMQGEASTSRGTGVLVGPKLVLTALHVVADRHASPPTPLPGKIVVRFRDHTTWANVLTDRLDAGTDWVLLELSVAPPQDPALLCRLDRSGDTWETFGFPDANPRDGMVQSGRVDAHEFEFDGVPAFQLFSEHAAAGGGTPVKGLSGAPVIVNNGVVGILRFSLMQDDKNVGGTLYATPVTTIAPRAPELVVRTPREIRTVAAQTLNVVRSVRRLAAIGLLLAATTASVLWRNGFFSPIENANVVAGQLFTIHSADVGEGVFARGLCDDILDEIASFAKLTSSPSTCLASPPTRGVHGSSRAGSILTGEFLMHDDTLTLTARLVRAIDTSRVIWERQFRVPAGDAPRMVDSVTLEVARALDIEVTTSDIARITDHDMTSDRAAYAFFQRGQESFARALYSETDARNAVALFDSATARDPQFLDAHALSAEIRAMIAFSDVPDREEMARRSRAAAERAIALQRYAPQGYRALGVYFYRARRAYDSALVHLKRARELGAEGGELDWLIGLAERRGNRWEAAAVDISRAADVEPQNVEHAFDAGQTLVYLRRFADAARYLDHAVALIPEGGPQMNLGLVARSALHIHSGGRVDSARLLAARDLELRGREATFKALTFREFRSLIRLLDAATLTSLSDARLRAADADSASYYLAKAEIFRSLGRHDAAQMRADSARRVIEARLRADPAAPSSLRGDLALAYARIGRGAEAVREARLAAEQMPPARDAYNGMMQLWTLTEVYLLLGRTTEARELIHAQIAIPGHASTNWIRSDPLFKPIAADPQFMATLTQAKN